MLSDDQVWGVDYYDDYCLARSWNQTAYLTANQSYVDICRAKDNYNDANFCYVDNPHSCGHLATGGTVSSRPSYSDTTAKGFCLCRHD